MMATAEKRARMVPVNLDGPAGLLDEVLMRCTEQLTFQKLAPGAKPGAFSGSEDINPYQKLLDRIEKIADNAQIALEKKEISAITAEKAEIKHFVNTFYDAFNALQRQLLAAQSKLEQSRNLLSHLRQLSGLGIRFERVFSCQYMAVRFGRLPADCRTKLSYYEEHLFLFLPFSLDGGYIWGAYFTTNEFAAEVDNMFSALFFERVDIPPDVRGTPAEALEIAQRHYLEDSSQLNKLQEQFSRLLEENRARFLRYYNEVRFLHRLYETRQYASIFSDRFYLTALVQKDRMKALEAAVAKLDGVRLEPFRARA